jgi:apolipoprotein N-acyltransferase
VSLHVYGQMPAWMAALAVLLFCAYLSLFMALAGWVQAKISSTAAMRLLVAMPLTLVAAEMLRSWFISGFPWLASGYTQTPSDSLLAPLAGYAPVLGVFGISWLLALTAGALLLLAPKLSAAILAPLQRRIVVGVVAGVWILGVLLQSWSWSQPIGAPLAVSLLQGNIAQNLKFRADQLQPTIDHYLALLEESRGRLIVLPETALPIWHHNIPEQVTSTLYDRARSNNGNVILGIGYGLPASDGIGADYFNGAISYGVDAQQRYAKHHLVAFGEFSPPMFAWVYRWLKIPMAGFTPGAAMQAPMWLSGHRIAVNICYEDTFGAEIARPLPEAELLVNISNMAWYGRSLAADQHAQFSQMRALETSRWMLRSTNTGVTAAIDEKGRIVATLPQFERGVLEVMAIPRQGVTPYTRWHDWPVRILLVFALAACLYQRRHHRRIQ